MPRRPVNAPYTITTTFGQWLGYKLAKFGYHTGVDYVVPTGTKVYAPVSGQLTNVPNHRTAGNMVTISAGGLTHRLMHNSSFSRTDGWVNEGDVVALSGNTGLTTGPHVHWDITKVGPVADGFDDFVSPARWLFGQVPPPAPAPAPAPKPQPLPFPARARVIVPFLFVRSGPGRSYPANQANTLTRNLVYGQTADIKAAVRGEVVNGNGVWYVTTRGNYIFSGGVKGL